MKAKVFRLFSIIFATLAIVSCTQEKDGSKPYVVQYAERLVTQYPNYNSNEIAGSAVKDSIKAHAQSFIGKSPNDLDGLQFHFDDFRDGQKGKCAIFTSNGYVDVDAPSNSENKHIISTIHIVAFGLVSNDVAAKLDGNKKYTISGKMHAWDGDNTINVLQSISYGDLDFGIYILDDMQVKEVAQ